MESEYQSIKRAMDESAWREQVLLDAMSQVAKELAPRFPHDCSFRQEAAGSIALFFFDNDNDVKRAEQMREEIERLLKAELTKSGLAPSDLKRVTVHFDRKTS